jgi:hypothetical protein
MGSALGVTSHKPANRTGTAPPGCRRGCDCASLRQVPSRPQTISFCANALNSRGAVSAENPGRFAAGSCGGFKPRCARDRLPQQLESPSLQRQGQGSLRLELDYDSSCSSTSYRIGGSAFTTWIVSGPVSPSLIACARIFLRPEAVVAIGWQHSVGFRTRTCPPLGVRTGAAIASSYPPRQMERSECHRMDWTAATVKAPRHTFG